jgi:hypothetical protein
VDGEWHERTLNEARDLAIEQLLPARGTQNFRGRTSIGGQALMSRSGHYVPFESRLEWRVLLTLDFDPRVERVSTQPFLLQYPGRRQAYVPDISLRGVDGSRWVLDVTPRLRAGGRAERGDEMARACRTAGWRHLVVGEPAPWLWRLVDQLSCARFAPWNYASLADAVLENAEQGSRFGSLCSVGDTPDALVRPVVLHLLWCRMLLFEDPRGPLSDQSVVLRADGSQPTDGWVPGDGPAAVAPPAVAEGVAGVAG